MTKLLLNAGSVPLYTTTGAPVAPGGVVLDDEMDEAHEALVDDGTLVYVRPGDLPDNLADANLSREARKHAEAGRNADAHSGDDASVKKSTSKGGQS